MNVNRRSLMGGAAALAGATIAGPLAAKVAPFAPAAGPRSRTIYVNDLAGDIDGLFATVHMLLSHTSELRGIVTSGANGAVGGGSVAEAAKLAKVMVEMCGLAGKVPVHLGVAKRLATKQPVRSAGVQAIIDEAMREDTKLPLYVAVGGGLTEVACALMIEPRIADRMKLVWIGGDDYPAGAKGEANFSWDPIAAQYVYNDSLVPIWQVPRSVYSTCAVSATELQAFVAPHGKVGAWLYQKVVDFPTQFRNRFNTGEMWVLGDSPLAVLTSLTDWVPSEFAGGDLKYERTGSSHYGEVICPTLNPDGTFTVRTEGRKIRIYKDIDVRMMFADFFAKLAVNFPAR